MFKAVDAVFVAQREAQKQAQEAQKAAQQAQREAETKQRQEAAAGAEGGGGEENTKKKKKSKKKKKHKKSKSEKGQPEQAPVVPAAAAVAPPTASAAPPSAPAAGFKWKKSLKRVLKDAPGHSLLVKKARKACFRAYKSDAGAALSKAEFKAQFLARCKSHKFDFRDDGTVTLA